VRPPIRPDELRGSQLLNAQLIHRDCVKLSVEHKDACEAVPTEALLLDRFYPLRRVLSRTDVRVCVGPSGTLRTWQQACQTGSLTARQLVEANYHANRLD